MVFNGTFQVKDLKNKVQPAPNTNSKFKCIKAKRQAWDKFKVTGGYSPRNEVYKNAVKFVDMWEDLVGTWVKPYRKCKQPETLHY